MSLGDFLKFCRCGVHYICDFLFYGGCYEVSDWLEKWPECFVCPVRKYKTYISYAGVANRYIVLALGCCEVAQLDGVFSEICSLRLVMRGSDGTGRRLSTSA